MKNFSIVIASGTRIFMLNSNQFITAFNSFEVNESLVFRFNSFSDDMKVIVGENDRLLARRLISEDENQLDFIADLSQLLESSLEMFQIF